MPSDLQHLERYAASGDAHAFRELVQAHGAMVHATALRVTRDAAAAQDVAQETFLELARKAGGITQSVAAWLHRVAWNRACDVVRRESTRRRFEESMAETWHTDREATWSEIEPHVDHAFNELPNDLREVLVLYFLEGRTQAEVARHLGKNQGTVSRAIERGVRALREALGARGLIAGVSLPALFASQTAHAMPLAVQASLGKISLSGIGTSASITTAVSLSATTTLLTMTSASKAILITSTLAAVSLPFALHRPESKPPPASPPQVVKRSEPKTVPKSNASGVGDEEMFKLLFGGDSDRQRNARSLVDDYRVAHPGKSLRELAQDPELTARLKPLMQDLMTQPEAGKQFVEAMQLAMQAKGIRPSPNSNINLNMGDGFLNTESQAERYLGAVLSNDAKALAQLFTDVVNEAAVEIALDPGADKTSNGVSISNTPTPPGTQIVPVEPED
jgi:RNA polymerase sigma factor (sigma-70 family)